MSDKVFRDPLYNYIAFDRERDGWLIDLANCREVRGYVAFTNLASATSHTPAPTTRGSRTAWG